MLDDLSGPAVRVEKTPSLLCVSRPQRFEHQRLGNALGETVRTVDVRIKALQWIAERTRKQAAQAREEIIAALEWASAMQKESGACEVVIPSIVSSLFCALRVCVPMQGWYQGCDAWVRKVAGAANGLLFQQLLEATGYCDVDCVNMLRHGADMLGVLKRSGIGAPLAVEEAKCSEQLRSCEVTRRQVTEHCCKSCVKTSFLTP